MDEVENPDLPTAGESSPVIRPVGVNDDDDERPKVPLDTVEAENIALPHKPSPPPKPLRPGLKRDISAPPPQQPPPAPPTPSQTAAEEPGPDAPDSLTLADLKRIRSTFPNANVPLEKHQLVNYRKVYDFEYLDAQSFPVELEEWFSYSEEEGLRLRKCKAAFDEQWRATSEGTQDWIDAAEETRRKCISGNIAALKGQDEQRTRALQSLTYICLGVWEETAGRHDGNDVETMFPQAERGGSRAQDYSASGLQIHWILTMVDTVESCSGLQAIYETLQKICDRDFASTPPTTHSRNETQSRRADESSELWCCLTLMYLFVELARARLDSWDSALEKTISALQPNLLNYLTQMVARLRWDEEAPVPLTKMILLFWKTILVTLGRIEDVERVKLANQKVDEDADANGEEMDARGQPIITASPLDYHLFRQEINSKYPAYQPPPPLFPLEPENNSILPPLKRRRPSAAAIPESILHTGPNVVTASIMHQPVHIATPAPSPPPSPGGPGKAGKKQNFQTNQMFPFLYPPLEADSNDLGGKGSTELQDALVGRRWEGSDIPTSILEAAELFAKRMRAPRGMRQLWEARVDFMKYERGWKGVDHEGDEEMRDVDGFEFLPLPAKDGTAEQGSALSPRQGKLAVVDEYYRDSLPYLQSVVIVLLKAVLQNVTDLVTKGGGQNGLQAGIQFNDTGGMTNGNGKPIENGIGHGDGSESTAEELDKLRSHEISGKALSAILLLLLKWFKANHVLQYEYMTQLLLDSNYVPLILKLWQTQEIGRACHFQLDREESNFFYFCQANSRQGPPEARTGAKTAAPATADTSEDEAAPPPIKLKRDSPEVPLSPTAPAEPTHPPEIDELGYPQTLLPSSPLRAYSYRNIFSSINYLRVLQKITRRKTHRALLLVSYKSTNHLKKTLRIPVELLRYYTLKLFKSQVPFCGRKWRQANMKVITAVWLSVPAELRDDWLTGGGGGMGGACVGDVDGTVEDALPLEQSLRALTHWWNVRNFPDVMGVDKGLLEEEVDFFQREIEKIELARALAVGDEGDVAEELGQEGESWQGPMEGY